MSWFKKIVLAGLSVYNLNEFIKKLKEHGVRFLRHGKGDDQRWGVPGTNRQTTIPFGPGTRTINPRTMTNMLKQLQIPLTDFKKRHIKQKEVIPEPVQVQQKPEEIPEWQNSKWYQDQQSLASNNKKIK